jgi:hypothetical protein
VARKMARDRRNESKMMIPFKEIREKPASLDKKNYSYS